MKFILYLTGFISSPATVGAAAGLVLHEPPDGALGLLHHGDGHVGGHPQVAPRLAHLPLAVTVRMHLRHAHGLYGEPLPQIC